MIHLFVGLGNPEPEYEGTRHNAGFDWLDALADHWQLRLAPERAMFGLVARGQAAGHPVWLLKPTTWMNASGRAVSALARFFRIAPAQILVVHDELDLPPGEARLKFGGGHAGHNGLRDIHAQLGTADYWRLRLGIGHPGVRDEVVHWVLRRPAPEQREALAACIARTVPVAEALARGDTAAATQAIHTSKPPRAKPGRPGAGSRAAAGSVADDAPGA